jgi:hypothetical protein
MPTTPTHPPLSTLRRLLAALRPGRPTAIACAIAIGLAAVGLDAARPDTGMVVGGPPDVVQPAAESRSGSGSRAQRPLPHRDRSGRARTMPR